MNLPNPTSNFVPVNGIRLHYLDWGGQGQRLIFLAGRGSSAYIFNQFAPRFNDQFRVLGLTRRGQGDSDYPATGYDAETLVEDIRQFMDAVAVERAILVGHSLAGVELTHFAATHPQRVAQLIYLDALDDRRQERLIMEQNPLRQVVIPHEASAPPRTLAEYIAILKKEIPEFAQIWSEVWDEEIAHGVRVNEAGIYVDKTPAAIDQMIDENLINQYAPPKVAAVIPMLGFYAQKKRKLTDAYTAAQKAAYEKFHETVAMPAFAAKVAEFQGRFPHAKIVVIPDGHHYCFMAQEALVYAAMRKFLATAGV